MPSCPTFVRSPLVAAFAAALLATAATAPAPLAAQERPDLPSLGNGARALGLGYAVTAVADDLNAIGWNPAGLTAITSGEFALTARLLVMGASATVKDFNPDVYPQYGGEGEITGGLDPIEFVGLAFPFTIAGRRVVPAVAYRRLAEGIRPGEFETSQRLANGRYFGSTTYKTTGGVRAISPSIGIALHDRVRVGATANLLGGSSTYSIRGPYPYQYAMHERDYEGLALDVGTLVTVRDGLTLGLYATLPHDRSFTFDNDTTVRAVTRAAPLALALGMALDLSRRDRLSADIRHAPWSAAAFTDDASGDSVASPLGVNDASSLHIGLERDVTNDIRTSKVRLGLFARRTTAVDLKRKAISGLGVTGGQSWYFPSVRVDVGLAYRASSRWVRSEDSAFRLSLRNHDFALAVGLTRLF
ncbi:MAG: hypothetical protein WD771_06835 [Gemmatimonadaceae bacterium]